MASKLKLKTLITLLLIVTVVLLTVMISSNVTLGDFVYKPFNLRQNLTKQNFLSQQYFDEINSLGTTWKSGRNFPENIPKEYLRIISSGTTNTNVDLETTKLYVPKGKNLLKHKAFNDYMGNSKVKKSLTTDGSLLLYSYDLPKIDVEKLLDGKTLPENYDSREEFPECSSISKIYHQSACSSSWAFATSQVFSDRICVLNSGHINVEISAMETLTCTPHQGCNGGDPELAWKYFITDGAVTGGSYGSDSTCLPYSYSPDTVVVKIVDKDLCENVCTGQNYPKTYAEDKYFATSSYQYRQSDENLIKWEILNYGPVVATMEIYEDFYSYRNGVYQRHSNRFVGYHSVRIIGWGEDDQDDDNNVPYWLVGNSWGPQWGDLDGFFKILRGKNECQIEQKIYAGLIDRKYFYKSFDQRKHLKTDDFKSQDYIDEINSLPTTWKAENFYTDEFVENTPVELPENYFHYLSDGSRYDNSDINKDDPYQIKPYEPNFKMLSEDQLPNEYDTTNLCDGWDWDWDRSDGSRQLGPCYNLGTSFIRSTIKAFIYRYYIQSNFTIDITKLRYKGKYLDQWECDGRPSDIWRHFIENGIYIEEKEDDLYYARNYYFLETKNETEIKNEIYHNGPVQTNIIVYEDFFWYKSGVYQRHTTKRRSKHFDSILIMGWGTDYYSSSSSSSSSSYNDGHPLPYWLVASTWKNNSWVRNWGDNGYGKIARGINEIGIESVILAGVPKI